MEIKISIDEAKILEIAKSNSLDELPRAIYYEVRKSAIEVAVNEIKAKLIEKPYYSGKEQLYGEVSNALYSQIEVKIKELIVKKFSEKEIESIITRHFDRTFTEWIEKKIFARLEKVKADVVIVSSGELENERQAEADAHSAEMEAMAEQNQN